MSEVSVTWRSSRRWQVLVIGLVATTLVLMFAWHSLAPSVAAGTEATPDPEPSADTENTFTIAEAANKEMNREATLMSLAETPPLEVVADSIDSARVHGGNPTDIALKYANYKRSELIEAYERLSPIHRAERDRLIAGRWDFGFFDVQFLPQGQTAPTPKRPDGSVPSFGFKTQPVEGGSILKTTVLNSDEYPDFTALELEVLWLRSVIGPKSSLQAETSEPK